MILCILESFVAVEIYDEDAADGPCDDADVGVRAGAALAALDASVMAGLWVAADGA